MNNATYAPVDNTKYFVLPNPGHTYITAEVPPAYGQFIMTAIKFNRFVETGRWPLAQMGKRLDTVIRLNGLDRDTAYAAWEAYCEFKDALCDYREAKVVG
jgi:hypothetical protein